MAKVSILGCIFDLKAYPELRFKNKPQDKPQDKPQPQPQRKTAAQKPQVI